MTQVVAGFVRETQWPEQRMKQEGTICQRRTVLELVIVVWSHAIQIRKFETPHKVRGLPIKRVVLAVSCPDENGGREQCISERDRRTRPSRNALLVVRLKCDLRGESSPPKTISGANRGQRHQADDRHFVVKSEYIR